MIFNIIFKILFNKLVHVGHYRSKWEALNTPYIYGIFKNIHIINLSFTVYFLRKSLYLIELISFKRGRIFLNFKTDEKDLDNYLNLFYIGYLNNYIKKQLILKLNKLIIKNLSFSSEIERKKFFLYSKKKLRQQLFLLIKRLHFSTVWYGGIITNFKNNIKSLNKKFKDLKINFFKFFYYFFFKHKRFNLISNYKLKKKYKYSYLFENDYIINKKITFDLLKSIFEKDSDSTNYLTYKLNIKYPPQLLFNLNNHLNFWSIRESMFKIPTIGIVDSNTKNLNMLYPIPGNDDTLTSILFYLSMFIESFFFGLKKEYLKFMFIFKIKKFNFLGEFNVRRLKFFLKKINKRFRVNARKAKTVRNYKLKVFKSLALDLTYKRDFFDFRLRDIIFKLFLGFRYRKKNLKNKFLNLLIKFNNLRKLIFWRYRRFKFVERKFKRRNKRRFFRRKVFMRKKIYRKYYFDFISNLFNFFFFDKDKDFLLNRKYISLKNLFIYFSKFLYQSKFINKNFYFFNYFLKNINNNKLSLNRIYNFNKIIFHFKRGLNRKFFFKYINRKIKLLNKKLFLKSYLNRDIEYKKKFLKKIKKKLYIYYKKRAVKKLYFFSINLKKKKILKNIKLKYFFFLIKKILYKFLKKKKIYKLNIKSVLFFIKKNLLKYKNLKYTLKYKFILNYLKKNIYFLNNLIFYKKKKIRFKKFYFLNFIKNNPNLKNKIINV